MRVASGAEPWARVLASAATMPRTLNWSLHSYITTSRRGSSTVTFPKLSPIGKVNVIRDEAFEVPGGKQHTGQYVVHKGNGLTRAALLRHLSHTCETGAYTIPSGFALKSLLRARANCVRRSGDICLGFTINMQNYPTSVYSSDSRLLAGGNGQRSAAFVHSPCELRSTFR